MPQRTIEINKEKLADINNQLASGATTIDIGGGRRLKATSPILTRMRSTAPGRGPGTVAFLRKDQASDTNVPTPTLPPTQGTQPGGQNINISPETTPSQFNMALQNILQSRVQKSNAPYISGGSTAMQGLLTLPEQLSSTEGWGGLNLSQARRLEQMEESGLGKMYEGYSGALEGKRSRLKDLQDTAVKAFEETQALEAEKAKLISQEKQAIEKRRQNAIDDFTSFRQALVKEGVSLSPESGQQFMNQLLTSDNPESVLSDYITAASGNPEVKAAYAKTGKTSTTSGTNYASGASSGVGKVNPLDIAQDFKINNEQLLDPNGNVVARITSPFGANHTDISGEQFHKGIDVVFDGGIVLSLTDGEVIGKGVDPIYGGFIQIQDPDGNVMQYAHMNPDQIKYVGIGSKVSKGGELGTHETKKERMGTATGAHTDIRFVKKNKLIKSTKSKETGSTNTLETENEELY